MKGGHLDEEGPAAARPTRRTAIAARESSEHEPAMVEELLRERSSVVRERERENLKGFWCDLRRLRRERRYL